MRQFERGDLREGMAVRSQDGAKLGKIMNLGPDTFLIEKGIFFKDDYLVQYTEILEVRDSEVIVGTNEQQLQDWQLRRDREAGLGTAGTTGTMGTTGTGSIKEETRIPVAEEELIAQKKQRQTGEVKVTKDVITEQKQVTVPVTREEVRVERTPVGDRPLTPGEASFKKEEVRIPVHEEEVEVTKRPVVREEVRVGKERVTEERTASANVKRETVNVDENIKDRPRRDNEPGPGRKL